MPSQHILVDVTMNIEAHHVSLIVLDAKSPHDVDLQSLLFMLMLRVTMVSASSSTA